MRYRNKTAERAQVLADQLRITALAVERGEGTDHEHIKVLALWSVMFDCEPETIAKVAIIKTLGAVGEMVRKHGAAPEALVESTRKEINDLLPDDARALTVNDVLEALRSFKRGSKISKWQAACALIRRAGFGIVDPENLRRQMARWKRRGISP
jgi:hypothetical protein